MGAGEGAPEKDSKPCHIPWAQLEHLKTPNAWAANHMSDEPPPRLHPTGEDRLKLYCLHGKHSLTPHLHGEIFWQPWDAKHSRTGMRMQTQFFVVPVCVYCGCGYMCGHVP